MQPIDRAPLTGVQILLWSILVALMLWLPRGLALDRFVTADEHAWLTRSGNFYRALSQGDFAATFQRHHPGVTVTWAGTLGFITRYPHYADDAPHEFGWLTEEIEPFLQEQGYAPIQMLAAGRQFVVLFIAGALLLSFWLTVKLFQLRAAITAFGLIAFSPFHIGLSRLMHLDGLLSSFMLLAVLAFLVYLKASAPEGDDSEENHSKNRALGYLLLSGVAAGLAWLTRSPGLFLEPFLGFVLIGWITVRVSRHGALSDQVIQHLRHFLIWAVIGGLTFVALWPAMWVTPLQSLGEVLNAARNYAAEGHLKPLFFDGQVISGDPGAIFYPVSFLWRATPITLVGAAAGIVGLVVSSIGYVTNRRGINAPTFSLVTLLIFALLFGLFMNLGDKKFDRYLLPTYLPLLVIAGWGWMWLTELIFRRYNKGLMAASTLLIVAQAASSLPTFPYYLSYYNPIMGGSARAADVMQIGWGEGADQAAAALNRILTASAIDATETEVASAYTNGPFSYFFDGTTLPIYFWHEADYAVLYAQDFQRRLPGPRQIRYFEEIEPLETVHINGLNYAWIFDLQDAPLPDYVTEWRLAATESPQVRLISYLFPSSRITPGEPLPMTLYFENLAPIEQDLSVLVRLVGPDGTEVARSEGWPQGRPTSSWAVGDTWADGHSLMIPLDTAAGYYRLDVSFYDPATLERLVTTRPLTDEILGDTLRLDFVEIGHGRPQPQSPSEARIILGDRVELEGITLQGSESKSLLMQANTEVISVEPNDRLMLRLHWKMLEQISINQTVFAHVVGLDGTVLTQTDEQPWGGFYPTSFWSRGREIVQPMTIQIPPDAAAGDYGIHVGMYDNETVTRLPVTHDGQAAGDSVIVTQLKVSQ